MAGKFKQWAEVKTGMVGKGSDWTAALGSDRPSRKTAASVSANAKRESEHANALSERNPDKSIAPDSAHSNAAEAHRMAAATHERAAAQHTALGNTKVAAEHTRMAKEHLAKASDHQSKSDSYNRDEKGQFASK